MLHARKSEKPIKAKL